MQVPFGDFKRQIVPIRAELDLAIARVLDSGAYILGQQSGRLKRILRNIVKRSFVFGVANGTDAIQIALVALGVGVGDEVITVANTGVPGTAAIVALGAIPVFVDVDVHSRNMDATLIAGHYAPYQSHHAGTFVRIDGRYASDFGYCPSARYSRRRRLCPSAWREYRRACGW
jgi:UDP-2-acetamido-2-deoxy-ribo-hexuluronate aminotransferase